MIPCKRFCLWGDLGVEFRVLLFLCTFFCFWSKHMHVVWLCLPFRKMISLIGPGKYLALLAQRKISVI
ncbi:hypothetical protein AB205_0137720 [Aquarana catesbeiana]|uniref:Uncharacterized protein n=1 Tax=Aquarana catesbeiana TaxID=8400 RepID=A0A2G9P846_AQUCT|nr:hypothetical protein AB205_0137720 [Aquarana catesbeiana]